MSIMISVIIQVGGVIVSTFHMRKYCVHDNMKKLHQEWSVTKLSHGLMAAELMLNLSSSVKLNCRLHKEVLKVEIYGRAASGKNLVSNPNAQRCII